MDIGKQYELAGSNGQKVYRVHKFDPGPYRVPCVDGSYFHIVVPSEYANEIKPTHWYFAIGRAYETKEEAQDALDEFAGEMELKTWKERTT